MRWLIAPLLVVGLLLMGATGSFPWPNLAGIGVFLLAGVLAAKEFRRCRG
jgi:hypothetical protein